MRASIREAIWRHFRVFLANLANDQRHGIAMKSIRLLSSLLQFTNLRQSRGYSRNSSRRKCREPTRRRREKPTSSSNSWNAPRQPCFETRNSRPRSSIISSKARLRGRTPILLSRWLWLLSPNNSYQSPPLSPSSKQRINRATRKQL